MKKIPLIILISYSLLPAQYRAQISPITPHIKQRMVTGNTWQKGCPVPLSELRYLTITYRGFDNREHQGEMIVHQNIAKEVVEIFGKLYATNYPIRSMRLVSDFHGSDFRSIEADNTSAFNCRPVTGGRRWSRHAYGKAIDINPIENPYISRKGHIAHKKSLPYKKRNHHRSKAVICKNDTVVKLFKAKGWRWGGDWKSIKDYQHFDKR